MIDFSGDVSFQTAHNLAFSASFRDPTLDVFLGPWVSTHATQNDNMQGAVRLSVSPAIQPVALCLATGGGYWAGATEHGKTGLAAQAIRIFSSRDNELAGGVCANAFELRQIGADFLD